jgi:hypothetical protein
VDTEDRDEGEPALLGLVASSALTERDQEVDPRNSGTREVPACHEVRPLNGFAIGPVSIT